MNHSHKMHGMHSDHSMCHCYRCCRHFDGENHGCSCGAVPEDGDNIPARMFGLALDAQNAVLMRLMEKHIEAKAGVTLDRIASLAADAVIDKMQRKNDRERAKRLYTELMRDAFQPG
jgi:hypothetical protein